MKLLIDTHIFMWMHETPQRLTKRAINLIVASIWEMQIKIKIGKFKFTDKLTDVIALQQIENSIQILPVELSHALYLENLENSLINLSME